MNRTLKLVILVIAIAVAMFFYYKPQSVSYTGLNLTKNIYIAPYIGDFDGSVSEEWISFYNKIIDFHEENKIPVTISFFPGTLGINSNFSKVMLRMYNSEYVELMQKSYTGDESEFAMYGLPYQEQYNIIKSGQDYFKEQMMIILNTNDSDSIKLPICYNQIGGRITNVTEEALINLGFKMYFDMFVEDDMTPAKSTPTFDVFQYGLGFTKTGYAGPENKFRNPKNLFKELNTFNREDVKQIYINKSPVIPLWVHHQDFGILDDEERIDKLKWEIYTNTYLLLKNNSKVKFINPSEIYSLRHVGV